MKFEKSSLPDATVEALEFPVALIRPYYQVSIVFFLVKRKGGLCLQVFTHLGFRMRHVMANFVNAIPGKVSGVLLFWDIVK